MEKIIIKTPEEIEIMIKGGRMLANVKNGLAQAVKAGVNAYEIEELAQKLIKEQGGEPSFSRVPGYSWATCVNVNDGIVHGIPKKTLVFKEGDLVSVDVGVYYQGFHTDTSISVGINVSPKIKTFLAVGEKTLNNAIAKVVAGNRIYDISYEIEKTLTKAGYTPVKSLVGHGVGRELHEDPQIPCFTYGKPEESPIIPVGAVLAVEVMYTMGNGNLQLGEEDGWTISTSDGTISGLFEETIAVTNKGPIIVTRL